MLWLLLRATGFLAYASGANDNFKGVASLYSSKTCGYRTALGWATLTPFTGSVCALLLAAALLKQFSGRGLVPDALAPPPRGPWFPFTNAAAAAHFPTRHRAAFHGLFYDGHIAALRPAQLRVLNFREPASLPFIPAYPGE